jgi:hypothetical protein
MIHVVARELRNAQRPKHASSSTPAAARPMSEASICPPVCGGGTGPGAHLQAAHAVDVRARRAAADGGSPPAPRARDGHKKLSNLHIPFGHGQTARL